MTTLKIPVTRLNNMATGIPSDYRLDTNTSSVSHDVYEIVHYDGNENQVNPSQIITFFSPNSSIFLGADNINTVHIDTDAPAGTYSVSIKFRDSSDSTYQVTFNIEVI